MVRLPISGRSATWRPANGHDDSTLADSAPGLAGAVAWVSRGVDVDVAALPVGDLDLLVLARRRALLGDHLVAEGRCAQCAAPVDIRFELTAYADHHRPRPSRAVTPRAVTPDGTGWYQLRSVPEVSFRVPTVADVLSAAAADDPRAALLAACTRGPLSARVVRTIETALATVAPTLRADVAGTCPDCATDVVLDVDVRELCLAELRFVAASVYDDVHLIASAYHWPQDTILDLPSARRRRYADMIIGRLATELGVTTVA